MNWTKFEDKMPKLKQNILVYHDGPLKIGNKWEERFNWQLEIMTYYGKTNENEDVFQNFKGELHYLTDEPFATHWAPLPNGPNLK